MTKKKKFSWNFSRSQPKLKKKTQKNTKKHKKLQDLISSDHQKRRKYKCHYFNNKKLFSAAIILYDLHDPTN